MLKFSSHLTNGAGTSKTDSEAAGVLRQNAHALAVCILTWVLDRLLETLAVLWAGLSHRMICLLLRILNYIILHCS